MFLTSFYVYFVFSHACFMCICPKTAVWLFWDKFCLFCVGNPAVLYIGIVESRQRSRAAVHPLSEWTKQCETQLFAIYSSRMKQNSIFYVKRNNNNSEVVDGNEQCSSNIKQATHPKWTKCKSIAEVRKWDDTYL